MKAMCILLVLVLFTSFAVYSESFIDLPADHWAHEAIESLVEKGIIIGYPDGSFLGYQPVSRHEGAAALDRGTQSFFGLLGEKKYATSQDIRSLRERLEVLLEEYRTLAQGLESLDDLVESEQEALHELEERVRILEE